MTLDRLYSRRLAAALGVAAAAVAAPIVIATGALSAGNSLGSEEPALEPTSTEESAPTTTYTYQAPTVNPENPGVPGNPGGTLGDIG